MLRKPSPVASLLQGIFYSTMAEGKQSFILYTDCKETVELLSDEQAGKLLKHILRYVNDENPIQDDKFVELVFTPIKLQLKRDLQKWDEIRADRSKAGKLSAEKRKQQASTKSTHVESVKQSSTNPTVNGTDNATATEYVIEEDIYKPPIDFLRFQIGKHGFEILTMQSTLPIDEFERACTQWSLKKEEEGWTYSTDAHEDRKKLEAGLKKWINTWVTNYRKQSSKNGQQSTSGQRKGHDIANIDGAADEVLRQYSMQQRERGTE